MANNLQVCMNKCNLIIKDISNAQQKEMQALVMKHMASIQAKYMMQIMDLFSKKDMAGLVRIVRVIIKEKDFKDNFSLLLDDVSELYRKNRDNVNKIIECFLSHCNPEAIELFSEVFGFVYDFYNVLNDKEINKKLETVQKYFIDNIKFAESLLDKHVKKSNVKSVENTKKPKKPKAPKKIKTV